MECVHRKHIIFRDTKPENFLCGRKERGEHNKIYMIDFGLVCLADGSRALASVAAAVLHAWVSGAAVARV
jgi:serine/threonine protein kinase